MFTRGSEGKGDGYSLLTNRPFQPVTGFVRITGCVARRESPILSGAPRGSVRIFRPWRAATVLNLWAEWIAVNPSKNVR